MNDLEEFRHEVAAWLTTHRPPEPDFLLPESFMEVGSDAQFTYLRDWQRKVYDAGYLGMAWPKEYGGGGRPQAFRISPLPKWRASKCRSCRTPSA